MGTYRPISPQGRRALLDAAARDNLRIFAPADVVRELVDRRWAREPFYRTDGTAFATAAGDGLRRVGAW
jgi:hypothetical protein